MPQLGHINDVTFAGFASHLILDTDEPFTVEPFQEARSELDGWVCNDGYRRIRFGESHINIFAADARSGDGVIPTLAVIDEAHRTSRWTFTSAMPT